MVDVFEDTLNIGAGCPSDVAVNTNTRFQGTVDYHLVNRGRRWVYLYSCHTNFLSTAGIRYVISPVSSGDVGCGGPGP